MYLTNSQNMTFMYSRCAGDSYSKGVYIADICSESHPEYKDLSVGTVL